MSLDSSTTQITSSVRRGSVQMRHFSSAETLPQISQKRTVSFTWISTSASRRTAVSSASSRWNAIRCADLGPMPGSLPSSSMRSWTMPSYTAPTVVVRADQGRSPALRCERSRCSTHRPPLLQPRTAPVSPRLPAPPALRPRPRTNFLSQAWPHPRRRVKVTPATRSSSLPDGGRGQTVVGARRSARPEGRHGQKDSGARRSQRQDVRPPPVLDRYSVARPRRRRIVRATGSATSTRRDVATLPPALLGTVHERVLTGLDDIVGTDRALATEIADRVVGYLRNT